MTVPGKGSRGHSSCSSGARNKKGCLESKLTMSAAWVRLAALPPWVAALLSCSTSEETEAQRVPRTCSSSRREQVSELGVGSEFFSHSNAKPKELSGCPYALRS